MKRYGVQADQHQDHVHDVRDNEVEQDDRVAIVEEVQDECMH
jgi:hypothetical protein